MKRKFWLCLVLALLLSGCGGRGTGTSGIVEGTAPPAEGPGQTQPAAQTGPVQEQPTAPSVTGRVYALQNGDHTTVFDSAGTVLFRYADGICTVLYDCFTGEAKYIQTERAEDTGRTDPYGEPVANYLFGLYRLDGTPVREESAFSAETVWDDLALSYSVADGSARLEDLKTGQILREDFTGFEQMDKGFLLTGRQELWTVDRDGALLAASGPLDYDYAYVTGGAGRLVVVSTGNGGAGVLDSALTPVTEFGYASVGASGDYLLLRGDGFSQVMDTGTGEIVFETAGTVWFYNGRCAVLQDGDWSGPLYLTDADGNRLTKGYDNLYTPEDLGGVAPAARWPREAPVFIASNYSSDAAGPEGKLLDQNGRILYETPDGGGFLSWIDGAHALFQADDGVTVLDISGNVLFSSEEYDFVFASGGVSEGTPVCLEGTRITAQGAYLTDLLDEHGGVILANLRYVFDTGPEGVLCERGFDRGLLDYDGNWVYRESIFDSMAED